MSTPSLEDLALHAVHALEPRDAEAVERAVQSNPALQAELSAMRFALAKLGLGVRQLDPPAGLEARIMKKVQALQTLLSASLSGTTNRPLGMPWARPAIATVSLMALALIAVLGVQSARLSGEVQALKRQTSQQTAILSSANNIKLTSTASSAVPIGQAYLTRDGQIVIALNLPTPAAGKTYQAWFIPKGETAPRPLQTFTRGLTTQVPPDAAAIAVSLEPSGGSKTPTTVLGVGTVRL